MGSPMDAPIDQAPVFTVSAQMDQQPLARIELIKGQVWQGELRETVIDVMNHSEGKAQACTSWRDNDFNPQAPAYWYVRVSETPTARWSKLLCESVDKCDEYPEANQSIAERAWSSPIWYLP